MMNLTDCFFGDYIHHDNACSSAETALLPVRAQIDSWVSYLCCCEADATTRKQALQRQFDLMSSEPMSCHPSFHRIAHVCSRMTHEQKAECSESNSEAAPRFSEAVRAIVFALVLYKTPAPFPEGLCTRLQK